MVLTTPVVLLIFNRPDLTRILFTSVARARPKKLLVVADGPRTADEADKCRQCRAIVEKVDWDCEVLTNFSKSNLGCKRRVSSGLDWAFSEVEEAIILEDDCFPHPTFFRFCQELLDFYRTDPKVMHIAGFNLSPIPKMDASFLFSRLVPISGWASWSRAWQHNDLEMKQWPEYKQSDDLLYFGGQRDYVCRSFEGVFSGGVDTWDTQWAYSCTINYGLSIIPKTNLVRNLGFRPDATHTTGSDWRASIPVQGLRFPLRMPKNMNPDPTFDERYLGLLSGDISPPSSLVTRFNRLGRRLLKSALRIK
jgi:hypothetical protein